MLEKRIVRKLTTEECHEWIDDLKREKALTVIRIEKLFATWAKNPGWAAYDKYADDIVGIDIRLDEQHAVAEWLDDDIQQLEERLDVILEIVAVTGRTPRPEEPVHQLGFFDSQQKRERMGVPC